MPKPSHFRVQTNQSKAKRGAKSQQPLIEPKQPTPGATASSIPAKRLSPAEDADRLKRAYTLEYRVAQSCQTGKPSNYSPSRIFDERGVWRKAAEELRAQEIDPMRYILVLFRELRSMHMFVDTGEASSRARSKQAARECVAESKRQHYDLNGTKNIYIDVLRWAETRPPTPGQIFGPRYQQMYEKNLENGIQVAALEKSGGLRKMRTRVVSVTNILNKSPAEASFNALLDENIQVGALTRHILAMSLIKVPEKSPELKKLNDKYRRIADRYWQVANFQFMHNEEGYREAWGNMLPAALLADAELFYELSLKKLEF